MTITGPNMTPMLDRLVAADRAHNTAIAISESEQSQVCRVLGMLPVIAGAIERAERAAIYLRDRGTALTEEDTQMLASALADIRDAAESMR